MTSQLNVDTIVDKAGSGGTNVKVANTSTYVSDGGAVTQNTVQGLAKALCHVSADGATASNTLNISSLDDDGTGDRGINFASSMGNSTYIVSLISEDGNSGSLNRTCDVSQGTMATGAFDFECVMTNSSTNRTNTDNINFVSVHGDLA